MNMNKNSKGKWTPDKILSVVVSGGIILALVFGVVSIVKTNKGNDTPNNYLDLNEDAFENEEPTTAKKDYVKLPSQEATQAPTKVTQEPSSEATTEAPTKTEQPVGGNVVSAGYSFEEDDTLLWPVDGDVVLKFSMDSTIWIPTLKSYRCNPAICISSAVGTEIKAAASGIVTEVVETKETGTNVIVDIGNGYTTVYGNVDNHLNLKKGDTVVAGEVIAKVAPATIFYSETGDNLYFRFEQDGKCIDPVMYMECE